jgi:hypothetical protein
VSVRSRRLEELFFAPQVAKHCCAARQETDENELQDAVGRWFL